MDVWCSCGAALHFDGDFAYAVRCPHCLETWQMPSYVPLREGNPEGHNVRDLQPDDEIAASN